MNSTNNKAVLRRLIEEVVNTGNTSILPELISPECVVNTGKEKIPCGIEGMAAHVQAVRQTYPDLHVTIENQIAEGEWVATQILACGTHTGSWLDMRPTGKVVTYGGVNFDRVVDGKVVEHGGAANTFEALLEIGAIRPVTSDE